MKTIKLQRNLSLTFFLTVICLSTYAQQSVTGSIGTINRPTPLFGFNTNGHQPVNFPPGYSGANWTQQWFIDSTIYLYPEVLRFPGGTNSNHWDWQTGWFVSGYQPSGPSLTIRTDEFKPGLLGCNGKGLYVVNLETSNVQYEMNGLRHADLIGLNPNLFELGNEHNLNGGSQYPLQLMSPTNYSQLAKTYYDSIIAEFPTAKICVVGGNTLSISGWNDTILSYIPTIDAFAFHVYLNANNADLAFNVNRALAVPFGPYSNTSSLNYRYNYTFGSLPSGKEIWVTEFNLLEMPLASSTVIAQSWTHVLYNMAMINFFIAQSNITMILNHSLAGSAHFESISKQNQKITANALSMKLAYDMSRSSQSCENIVFSGNPSMTYGTSVIPKLIGWKFNHVNFEKGFICNFSTDTFKVSLSTVFTNTMQFDQFYADTNLVVNGLSSLNKYSGSSTDSIVIYPFSITQINSSLSTGIQVEQTTAYNRLWIYPNPSQGSITIQTKHSLTMAEIHIYNIMGQEVSTIQNISGQKVIMKTDGLTTGTYFIKIKNGDEILTTKIIVE